MIKVDVSGLVVVAENEVNAALQKVSTAVAVSAEHVASEWSAQIDSADGLSRAEKVAYAQSIKVRMTGPFSAEVFSDYSRASEIENGSPSRDLKRMLRTSRKTRVSAKGNRYLIIPFRHNTPGNDALARTMPRAVYLYARNLAKSRVAGQSERLSSSGYLVPKQHYRWGDRLPQGLAPKFREHHKTDLYAGMVRMGTSSGKQYSSAYLTFRTMSEKSSGWLIPRRPGVKVVEKVENKMAPVINKMIHNSIDS